METTTRSLMTGLHGLFFGAFFLMVLLAVVMELWRSLFEVQPAQLTPRGQLFETLFLIKMAVLGWLAVLSGTYIIYPWYRAAPPAGTTDLTAYPRSLLLAHANTAMLHSMGMEWKEHIGWFAPILVTMLAFVMIRHRAQLRRQPQLRRAVVIFALAGFLCTGVAGLAGALLNKQAPVTGGNPITFAGASK